MKTKNKQIGKQNKKKSEMKMRGYLKSKINVKCQYTIAAYIGWKKNHDI